jgi:hypothetical protein
MTSTETVIAAPGNLVAVQHWVPFEHVVTFQRESQALLTRLSANTTTGEIDLATWDSSLFTPPYNSNHRGEIDPWLAFDELVDSPGSRQAACWIVDNFTPGGRTIAAAMLAHPDGMHTFDLGELGGYNDDGISSAIRAIAGRFRACAIKPFWRGTPDTKGHARGQLLAVPTNTDAYRVFTEVFAARWPDVVDAVK